VACKSPAAIRKRARTTPYIYKRKTGGRRGLIWALAPAPGPAFVWSVYRQSVPLGHAARNGFRMWDAIKEGRGSNLFAPAQDFLRCRSEVQGLRFGLVEIFWPFASLIFALGRGFAKEFWWGRRGFLRALCQKQPSSAGDTADFWAGGSPQLASIEKNFAGIKRKKRAHLRRTAAYSCRGPQNTSPRHQINPADKQAFIPICLKTLKKT
jgi:hypothetical protein